MAYCWLLLQIYWYQKRRVKADNETHKTKHETSYYSTLDSMQILSAKVIKTNQCNMYLIDDFVPSLKLWSKFSAIMINNMSPTP